MGSEIITLLDGGMGQELRHRSAMPASPLWSTQVLLDEPHLVADVHRDYIAAGADLITLASYSTTPCRFERTNADPNLFDVAQKAAMDIAVRARDESGRAGIRIGGCLPPLFFSYRTEDMVSVEECLATYRRIVATQKDVVDVFLCETMSTIQELQCAVTAAAESGKPVWCGVTVDDADGSHLRSGESVAEAARTAIDAGASAFLINCSFPEAVTTALATLGEVDVPTGGYANGFTTIAPLEANGTVDVLEVRNDLDPAGYAAHVDRWIDLGATIVGGCCEVGPAHIAEMARRLGKA
jgi:homocysteine S-methyltransferase